MGRRSDGSAPGLEGLIATLTGGGDDDRDRGTDAAVAARPSSSPIQRAVTSAFKVTQIIRGVSGGANAGGSGRSGRVDQVVTTPLGNLWLKAAARVDPAAPSRITFAFDEGYFLNEETGVRLPYPVPFRLLGKEAEGWLDTSWLGERLRVSTGNKGSTFVLKRVAPPPG